MDEYLKETLKAEYDSEGKYGEKSLAYFIEAAKKWCASSDSYLKTYGEGILRLIKT